MNIDTFRRRHELQLSGLRSLIQEYMLPPHLNALSGKCLDLVGSLQRQLEKATESDLIPHCIFREPIACREDAERLLRYLHDHGMTFHPDDDPADLATPLFTEDEARNLRHRMQEASKLDWSEHECPCGFILSLDEEFEKAELTGHTMSKARDLLSDLAASYEHPGYISITTATHDFAIGNANFDYQIEYRPLTRKSTEMQVWPEELDRSANSTNLSAWIREQINSIQLKDTPQPV
jgi:hypothetical protein